MTTRKTADGYTIQGFKMKLLPGFAAEYERRHDELWPVARDGRDVARLRRTQLLDLPRS